MTSRAELERRLESHEAIGGRARERLLNRGLQAKNRLAKSLSSDEALVAAFLAGIGVDQLTSRGRVRSPSSQQAAGESGESAFASLLFRVGLPIALRYAAAGFVDSTAASDDVPIRMRSA